MLFRELYERVWFKVRDTRPNHKSFSDEFLWHDVYDFYAKNLPRLSAEGERDLIGLWQDHGDREAPTIQSPGGTPPSGFHLPSGRHNEPSPRRRSTPMTVIVTGFTNSPRSAYSDYSWRLIGSI